MAGPSPVRSDEQIRILCITIVLFGNVSFRSVPRILSLFLSGDQWIPHFTSVINWTLRLGLALLNQVAPIDDAWVAILDHSIDIGIKKVLVVLRVRLGALQARGSALRLEDCECVGIQVSEKTDGETIAAGLSEIFESAGAPVAIIKDGGRDLARGVELWQSGIAEEVEVIDDIGHVTANALKAQYAKSKLFAAFLSIINHCAKRLRQTRLAFLAPPKLRTKGRFQGISKFAEWAEKIIKALDGVQGDPEYKKLRQALSGFSQVKDFVCSFARSVLKASEIMKILKNQGLNKNSYTLCMDLAAQLPERSKVKKRITAWLEKHMLIHDRLGLGDMPMAVSSDIIESLFGKFKHILERGSMIDMNRSVLIIPTLCGVGDPRRIQQMDLSNHAQLVAWDQANIPYTQNRRRRAFLHGKPLHAVPKTGGILSQTG